MPPPVAVAIAAPAVVAVVRIAEHANLRSLEHVVHMRIPLRAHRVQHIGVNVGNDFLNLLRREPLLNRDGDVGDAGIKCVSIRPTGVSPSRIRYASELAVRTSRS